MKRTNCRMEKSLETTTSPWESIRLRCPRLRVRLGKQSLEIKKDMDETEANAVRAKNEEIRKERDRLADGICQKFSAFKKDFIGAPMRRALKNLAVDAKGSGNPSDSCEIPYRIDEKYWVVAAKAEVTISFALQFDN